MIAVSRYMVAGLGCDWIIQADRPELGYKWTLLCNDSPHAYPLAMLVGLASFGAETLSAAHVRLRTSTRGLRAK